MNVYHYTSRTYCLPRIVESGELRSSNAGFEYTKALLWFSKNQQLELTAARHIQKYDTRSPNKWNVARQLVEAGCIRFALPADDSRLMDWQDACWHAGITDSIRRQMEKRGRKWGAPHTDWLAIADTVSLTELPLQRLDGGVWVDTTVLEELDVLARKFNIPTLEEIRIARWKKENAALIEVMQEACPGANIMFI